MPIKVQYSELVEKEGSNMSNLVWWLVAVCVVILGSIKF